MRPTFYLVSFLFIFSISFPLCGGGEDTEIPYIYTLWVEPNTVETDVNTTVSFHAFLLYSDGSSEEVTDEADWSSSDESVATLDGSVATGIHRGETEIIATYDEWTSNSAHMTVIPRLDSITISPETAELKTGDTVEFNASALYNDGIEEDVSDSVTWFVSNSAIAKINNSGKLTALDIGEVEVSAEKDDVKSNTALISITDYSVPAELSIVINEILVDVPMEGDPNRDGISDSRQDEFIELVNYEEFGLDISGCTIKETDHPDTPRHIFDDGTIIPGRKAVVVFGGGVISNDLLSIEGAQFFISNAQDNPPSLGLDLTDDGDTITFSCNDTVIATFEYGGDTGLAADIDMSLTRNPDITGVSFYPHGDIPGSIGPYSPGTKINGETF